MMDIRKLSRKILEKLPSARVTYIARFFALNVEYENMIIRAHLSRQIDDENFRERKIVSFYESRNIDLVERRKNSHIIEKMKTVLLPLTGKFFYDETHSYEYHKLMDSTKPVFGPLFEIYSGPAISIHDLRAFHGIPNEELQHT